MIVSGVHRYPVRVYYDDTDAGGIVYHATYLRMAERARTEALRELGAPHSALVAEHGLAFVVRHAAIDYWAPARLDDALVIETRPASIGLASVRLEQAVFNEARSAAADTTRPLVVMHLSLVCVAPAERGEGLRPARIPERWRAAFATLAPAPSSDDRRGLL